MPDKTLDDYTFDELSSMYKENPEQFDELRNQLIENELQKVTDVDKRNRYRAMVHNINLKASRYKNDMVRLETIASAMWESFHDLNDKLQSFSNGTVVEKDTKEPSKPSVDNVVPFVNKTEE